MLGFDSINARHTDRSMLRSCCICSICPPKQLHFPPCHVSNLRYWLLILCCLLPNPLCPLRCPPKASTLHSWQAQRGRVHAVALSHDETLVATAGPLLGPPGTGTGAGTGAGAGAKKGPAGHGVCVWSLRSCAEVARYTGAAGGPQWGQALHLFVLSKRVSWLL